MMDEEKEEGATYTEDEVKQMVSKFVKKLDSLPEKGKDGAYTLVVYADVMCAVDEAFRGVQE